MKERMLADSRPSPDMATSSSESRLRAHVRWPVSRTASHSPGENEPELSDKRSSSSDVNPTT